MSRYSQRGVALVTVLLVVVIATVLATAMIKEQHLSISSARNVFDYNQARQYALGGEELARQILHQDFVDNNTGDHLMETWAQPDLFFEFEDGEVTLQITDLQGRINVNGLAPGAYTNETAERLRTLFTLLGVDPLNVARIRDWIDADDGADVAGGAEDFNYLGLDQPYRTSGALMTDLSEMRLLLDLDNETFQLIAPYLSAIPDANVKLNLNTASGPVLQSLHVDITPEVAEGLIVSREQQEGFPSVANLKATEESVPPALIESGLSVKSGYFEVRVKARYQERFAYLTSVLQRTTDGSIRVVYRNTARQILPVVVEEEDQETDA